MKDDPAIDAIRKVRHEMSAAVGHDIRKLIALLRELQARHPERLISQPAPPLPPPADEAPSAEARSAAGA